MNNISKKTLSTILTVILGISLFGVLGSYVKPVLANPGNLNQVQVASLDLAPGAVNKSQTGVVLAAYNFTSNGEGTVNALNFTCTGSWGSMSSLYLVLDTNNNTKIDGGEYTIAQAAPAAYVSFGANASVNSGLGGSINFTVGRHQWVVLLVCDISSTASIGNSFSAELHALTDAVIYDGAGTFVAGGLTAQAGTSAPYASGLVIVQPTGTGTLLAEVAGGSDTNTVANLTNIKAMKLTLTAAGYDVVVSSIGFNLVGTVWSGNVSSIALLDAAYAAVSGTWSDWSSTSDATAGNAFTFASAVTIAAGSSNVYYLYFNVSGSATTGWNIRFRIRNPANVTATSNSWSIKSSGKWLIAPQTTLATWGPGGMDSANFAVRDRGALTVSSLINPAAGYVARGTTYSNITTFYVKANYEDLNVTQFGLNLTGASTVWAQNITSISLYNVNASAYVSGSWSAWSSTSSAVAGINFTVTNGLTIPVDNVVFFRVDVTLNQTALGGAVVQLGLNATLGDSYVNATGLTSGLTLNTADKCLPTTGAIGNWSTAKTIRNSGYVLVQDWLSPASAGIYVGTTKTNMTTIAILASYEDLNVTGLSFNLTTAANYLDVGTIAIYNTNASAYVAGTWSSWLGGGINFTITGGLTVPQAKVIVLRVDVPIKSSATPVHTIQLKMDNTTNAAFFINATGISSATDLNAGDKNWGAVSHTSNTLTITGQLSITGASQAPAYVTQGQLVSMLRLQLQSVGETVMFTTLKVQLNGTATAANYSAVRLYLDNAFAGTAGVWDSADSLIVDAGAPGTSTVTFNVAGLVSTNSTVFVVVQYAAGAKAGATSIVSIHDAFQTGDVVDTGYLSAIQINPTLTTVASNTATVQDSSGFAYIASSLSPAFVHQGQAGVQFVLQLNKTIAGSASCTLSTGTYFSFADGTNTYTAYLAGPVSYDAGIGVQTAAFAATDMPAAFVAGYYNATITLVGTDANNAPIAGTVNVQVVAGGAVLVDNTAPSIIHTAVTSSSAGVAIVINATVTDASSGVDRSVLYYKKVGDASYASVVMLLAGTNTYTADIPASYVTSAGVQYYIDARDYSANVAFSPATGAYSVTVVITDTIAPVITHTAVASSYDGVAISVSAGVTDNVAVASVTLYYKVTGAASYTSVAMSAAGSTYSATIPAASVTTVGVQYYITAVDSSANSASAPATGAYSVAVSQFVVSATEPALKDVNGNEIASTTAGTQVLLSTKLNNHGSAAKALLYIVQVKNAAGSVVFISFVSGTVPAATEYEFGIAWTPSAAGTYSVEAFAWKSWTEPEAYSEVSTSSVIVT